MESWDLDGSLPGLPMEGNVTKLWSLKENRVGRLVFIGRNISESELRQQFDACVS